MLGSLAWDSKIQRHYPVLHKIIVSNSGIRQEVIRSAFHICAFHILGLKIFEKWLSLYRTCTEIFLVIISWRIQYKNHLHDIYIVSNGEMIRDLRYLGGCAEVKHKYYAILYRRLEHPRLCLGILETISARYRGATVSCGVMWGILDHSYRNTKKGGSIDW
jgi:hypothetical protein